VPDDTTLDAAYRRVALRKRRMAELEKLDATLRQETASMPLDVTSVRRQVEDLLECEPWIPWDAAVASIARADGAPGADGDE